MWARHGALLLFGFAASSLAQVGSAVASKLPDCVASLEGVLLLSACNKPHEAQTMQ